MLRLFLTLALIGIVSPLVAQDAPKFRAGAATSNITPPLGSPIVGGFVPFPATHVYDELHARCLVLDDGAGKPRLPRDKLLVYRGADGKPVPVKTVEDWAKRRAEVVRGMEAVMGKLP